LAAREASFLTEIRHKILIYIFQSKVSGVNTKTIEIRPVKKDCHFLFFFSCFGFFIHPLSDFVSISSFQRDAMKTDSQKIFIY
jgi:hypothetical protein